MKVITVALQAHYDTRNTTIAHAMLVERRDGQKFGFTSHDVNDTISSVLYKAQPGLIISSLVIAANTSVGNLELRTLDDGTVFTRGEVLGGLWSNAKFTLFKYNWASLGDGVEVLLTGTLGEFQLKQGEVVSELRDLRQYIQQPVGDLSSKTCRARFGDARCRKPLGPLTVTGAVTGVTSQLIFTDSSRTEADDYFGEGLFTWNTGNNAGISVKCRNYASDTFTLALPMFGTIQVGDTYTAIAGCRLRLEEDCRDKHNNVLNFYAEPHRKGLNDLTAPPPVPVA